MSNTCTLILVSVVTPVSDILLLSITAKFPFIVNGHQKNLIVWNWLKNFMQVEVNVLCMHTNFGGCDFFGFGDIVTFKNSQISLSDHGL